MKQYIILFIVLLFSTKLVAQKLTNKQIENNLIKRYEKLTSFPYGGMGHTYDSIEYYDSLFAKELAFYTSHYPSTLTYHFDSLNKNTMISIATSSDGRLRIYSWDTWNGGTMHSTTNLLQFKIGDKVYSKYPSYEGVAHKDLELWYSGIDTVNAHNQTCYLAFGRGKYSTRIVGQCFKVFTIKNYTVKDTIKLIKKKDGQFVNQIFVGINLFLNYPGSDTADTYGELINFMEYKPKKKTLIVPVIDHWTDSVTAKSDVYQFNGTYFKYIKTKNTVE